MKEILITSSALILALLLIRRVFKRVLSRRFQYALWALVLARLLIPNSLSTPAADFSVLTATAPVQNAVVRRLDSQIHYSRPQGQVSQAELSQRDISVEYIPTAQDGFVLGESEGAGQPTTWLVRDPETNTVTRYNHMTVGPWDILNMVWKVGMVLMGGFFLLSNLWFYLRLRRTRRPYATLFEGGTRKVYLVPDGVIPSPCLFGRSIYITPSVAEDEKKLRHVLTHEETHARHLDPLWSLLRCLCLTVYWFDPLVWIAAACSRADCELACDESVLKALGKDERIPYGQTLLSLIPVKRVGNPMLAATTMTAGKKQLKDRVTRIAKQPRQLAAAAFAVAVLAVVVSACTFTGAKPETVSDPIETQEPQDPRALTGEELRWFNEEFFNSSGSDQSRLFYTSGDGEENYYNIRNQFINASFNLYDKPEDIDLYELFYCDGDAFSEEDYQALELTDSPCAFYKLTSEQIDNILFQNTGLTLEQTNKVNFTYEYNDALGAYVWGHGDTNYPGDIEILCGTRQGSTVKLYHHGWNRGSQWYETTLTEQSDGSYWFVSNRESEKPSIPIPLPAWDPVATISLADLEPYIAPTVTVEPHPNHYSYRYETSYANWNIDDHHIVVYQAADGVVYAAYEENDVYYVFQSDLPKNSNCVFFYDDLLGHDGFYLDYYGQYNEAEYGPIRDYYYFTTDGILTLLARCHGDSRILDLDGDGQNELIAPRQLFFQRDGVVYEAWLDELLLSACPQLSYWDYEQWDKYSKCLYVNGYSSDAMWERYLYFDGENLLIYKHEKPTTDHMVDGVDKDVPEEVVQAARDYAKKVYEASQTPTAPEPAGEIYAWGDPAVWDDWRVESFTGFYSEKFGETTIEGWAFTYELHTTTPENVMLAGGKYITEDNWVSPGYPGCDWLFFRLSGTMNEKRTFLWHSMINDASPGSYGFRQGVIHNLERQEVELERTSYAALQIQAELDCLVQYDDAQLILYPADGIGGGAYPAKNNYNGANRQLYFTQPGTFRWTKVDGSVTAPTGTSLVITDNDWYRMLQFWEGSSLVMSKGANQEPVWYRAEPVDTEPYPEDIFTFMRMWYDEAELLTTTEW